MHGHGNRTAYRVPVVALLILIGVAPARAFSQTLFYQGKTITVIAATSAGGTGDLRIKAVLPFLRKHIPGNPMMIMEYMDGGGGRKAVN
jgi:tripartite-type tricarboxylate transporter receptor subunit TctC